MDPFLGAKPFVIAPGCYEIYREPAGTPPQKNTLGEYKALLGHLGIGCDEPNVFRPDTKLRNIRTLP